MPMKCKTIGCGKSACYRYNKQDEDGNDVSEGNRLYLSCAEHKEKGMVPIRGIVRGTLCIECKNVRACYAMVGELPLFCANCKQEGMVNISNYRNSCSHETNGVRCGKWPSCGIEKATRCAKHKEEDMIRLR